MAKKAFFITGTDTNVGKTLVAAGLLVAANNMGLTTAALKPVAAGCEKTEQGLRNADALYRRRKRFVEQGVVFGVDDLVRQLVEQQAHKVALGPGDKGGEQRVAARPVHIAQRGIRGHAIHLHFQPLGGQLRCLGLRGSLGKVAPVANATRHREAPGVQREGVRRRGHHVPDGGGAFEVRIAAVAGVVRQAQLGHGKGAGALGQLQARAQGDYYLEERNVAGKFGSFAVLDLSARYQINPAWSVDLQVKNATGREYAYAWYDSFFWEQAQPMFSPAAGRSVYVGLNMKL